VSIQGDSEEDTFELARLMRTDAVTPPKVVEFPFTTAGVREALHRLHDQKPGGKIVIKMAAKK
jgi:threonine dehydrogenase-like Zn-dependent dehydrogenase